MKQIIPHKNWLRYLIRMIWPIPKPPNWKRYNDVCQAELVPYEDLKDMYKQVLTEYWTNDAEIIHLEFGIFNGTSLAAAYFAYKELGIRSRIIAFDSFKGLPSAARNDDLGTWEAGEYFCSREKFEYCMKLKGVDVKEIEIVEGWYQDTLTNEKKYALKLNHVDVVFVDCDTYLSSKAALNFIEPLIHKKTLICLDDWRLHNLDLYELGESKSYNEFKMSHTDLKANRIKSYSRKSESFILVRDPK